MCTYTHVCAFIQFIVTALHYSFAMGFSVVSWLDSLKDYPKGQCFSAKDSFSPQ